MIYGLNLYLIVSGLKCLTNCLVKLKDRKVNYVQAIYFYKSGPRLIEVLMIIINWQSLHDMMNKYESRYLT